MGNRFNKFNYKTLAENYDLVEIFEAWTDNEEINGDNFSDLIGTEEQQERLFDYAWNCFDVVLSEETIKNIFKYIKEYNEDYNRTGEYSRAYFELKQKIEQEQN